MLTTDTGKVHEGGTKWAGSTLGRSRMFSYPQISQSEYLLMIVVALTYVHTSFDTPHIREVELTSPPLEYGLDSVSHH